MMFPDTFDPAELREQAKMLEEIAGSERYLADMIELSVVTNVLSATDETGRRGIERLLALDPVAGLAIMRHLYARVAALALQLDEHEAMKSRLPDGAE